MKSEKNARSSRNRPYSSKKTAQPTTVSGVSQAPVRPSAVQSHDVRPVSVHSAVAAARDLSSNTIPSRRFQDLNGLVDPIILKTITQDLKFDEMMPVQAASLDDLLSKRTDCLVQAKTGTGKTLAFLIPAIQTMINKRTRGISLLVITPTRELAQQIAKEAEGLLQNLPKYRICVAIGGTNKDREERAILSGCDILIATPGRLIDHLSEESIVDRLASLNTLVLDEADRLLDMGFMPSLQQIVRALPDKVKTQRQGMLFSATIAEHVQKVAHLILAKDYKFISTIPEGEVNTHERVPQLLIEVPQFTDVAPALLMSLHHECQENGKDSFKAIIFAPTAAMADWYAAIIEQFKDILPPCSVLHSRVSQSKRTKLTADFKGSKSAILVATDVIARGMDFPDVSHVFQAGVPAERESYIHRLGRTARAGKEGRGIFITTAAESFFPKYVLRDIKFEPITVDYLSFRPKIDDIALRIGDYERPYQAWMGYYKNHLKSLRWDTAQLVQEANRFALEGLQSPEVPALQRKTVGKMGLKGVPGLVLKPNEASNGPPRGGGRAPQNGGGREGPSGGGSGGRGGRSNGGGGRGRGRA
ncbi:Predicted protein [Taphrina deformans PYCC 5710]|uniref:ATP-dependent RNA helicase n=1 Tax=Taphrina deformans (strain PYCC 5710 / ATCC 11124 / CBS 356.35 / IMI 108563 / JCM 9778 / NBRC 8474) TaxID=1097556 RepID=R4XAT4_TAPDE|nr:Predicted protein [Taphrina deformans PYCC 5710]|eukprot:CCG82644.1 Predicted protein [Taphrina deformans PYCC 5710]